MRARLPNIVIKCVGGLACAFAFVSCDGDCLGFIDPPPPPPDTLPPGAPLDQSVVDLTAPLRDASEVPVPLTRARVEQALISTGFGVRYADGLIVVDDSKAQGIVFEPWDIDTIAAGLNQGMTITLDDYAATWEMLVPSASATDVKAALLSGVAAAAASEEPAQRAYGQLLVSLGRDSASSYDLLDPHVDGAKAQLDALQIGLLTYRISAELWQSVRNIDGSQKTQALDGALPCTQTDTEGLVMDATALTSSFVWGHVLDHLVDKGVPGAERFSGATQVANAALVYAKLAWTMVAFRVDMHATPQPLVRTLTTTAGAEATVTAKFALDGTGKAQVLNCMRIAMNAINLDFSVPQDGPLAGKTVEWQVVARGSDDVVQTKSGDVLHGETSSSGEAKLLLEGKPQATSLVGRKTVPVNRRPRVMATTNLKNKDFAQDMIDAGAGVTGLGALWSMPAEILNRMPLLFNGVITVVVEDRKLLEGDHFHVQGVYEDPSGVGSAVLANNVADRFDADIEVIIKNDVLTASLLTWSDEPTVEHDTYENPFTDGEDCMATITIHGRDEVFTSRHKETVDGYYVPPGTPGLPEQAFVSLVALGTSQQRGYHVEPDDPSCPPRDYDEMANETAVGVTFDSTMFSGLGSSTVVDDRSGGVGWIFTITYVE